MRTAFAYSSARILLFVVAVVLLYLIGARGLLLLALALVVSGIASYVLLSKQRDRMSGALTARLGNGRRRAHNLKARLDEGARAEDDELEAAES
jgi:Mn2+/Fe2+ NRAMP family transporter